MNYTAPAFYFLTSAVALKARTVGAAYESMCTYMGYAVSMPCLLHALRGLEAGGYVTTEPTGGVVTASTPLTVTPAGRKLAAISPLQRLMGEYKAHRKNLVRFCDMERPETPAEGLTADGDSFAPATTRLLRAGDIALPTFEITDGEDGCLRLTVHHPGDDPTGQYDAEDIDPDSATLAYSASVTGTDEQIRAALHDLVETAYLLVTDPRPRKVALHGRDGSLLIALANAADEYGTVVFRMTVSKIRFNRQRFLGKRDAELDYAQCGDPIFTHEMRSARDFALYDVFHSVLARPDLLSDGDSRTLQEILRRAPL